MVGLSINNYCLLVVDTSGPRAAAALSFDDGECRDRCIEAYGAESLRGEKLATIIESLFRKAGIGRDRVTAIGVVAGPGSYTGLRAGLAFARGFAIADQIPLIGLGSLELVAFTAFASGVSVGTSVLALLDATRGKFYGAAYRVGATAGCPEPIADATVLAPDEVGAFAERVGAPILAAPGELVPSIALSSGLSCHTVPTERMGLARALALRKLELGLVGAEPVPIYVGGRAPEPNTAKAVLG